VASPDLELVAAVPELGASPNGAEKETIPIA
jgi:hypothetical protein